MKNLYTFLQNFISNKGHHVFLSLLVAKICGFLGSLFIIRILPANEFGTISIVASVFFIFAAFNGFGSNQILLRYGSIIDEDSEKKVLSNYVLKQGFVHQFFICVIFFLLSCFYVDKYQDIVLIFLFFAVRLLGYYFFNHLQAEFRIFGNNKAFAQVGNFVNIVGVLLLLLSAYYFGLFGYLIAIALTPFLCLFFYKKMHFASLIFSLHLNKKELWNYGFHAAGTALLSDMLFSADVLMLSFLMNESAVANYKVALLIPANITFLALTFMQSDFPILAQNFKNKSFLKDYIGNYYKIFIPISIAIFGIGFLFKSEILHLFFSEKYDDNSWIFIILLGGFCANMLLRNLYGNLLSAVGKMKVNTIVSLLALLFLLLLGYNFISIYGVMGMAISLSLSMIFSGFLLMYFFFFYLKELK